MNLANYKRIAVLKAARIGDFICTTPALRALRRALPDAEITLITLPMLRELGERLDSVDQVVDFPGYPGIAEQLFEPRAAAAFFVEMQARRFDLAVQLQGSGVNANPFMLMLGATHTVGFVRPDDGPGLLAAALPLPEYGHEVERMLALPRSLGLADAGCAPEYPLWPEDHVVAMGLLADTPPPLIGLHPGARDTTRRWPTERFAEVARVLHERYGGTAVLLGEPDDPAISVLAEQLPAGSYISLAGRCTLPVLGAVIARLSVLITNDSGPAHIAYALDAPTVSIFGAGDPLRYASPIPGPFTVLAHPIACRPCGFGHCPINNACLQAIAVAQVVAAAERLLQQK